ncbi:MAG: carboxymuconolactone decarboxylase family protein [Halanaerobiales bacterium]
MSGPNKEFWKKREELNKNIFESGNLEIKRFFNLDTNVYKEGALPTKNKEMLGLVASMVLRCDDCITYHIDRCYEEGVNKDEFYEAFSVALVVGGSIVIPHLRRAAKRLEDLFEAGVDKE